MELFLIVSFGIEVNDMKKLYLITMSGVKNYGSALQTYASVELLKKYNVSPVVINYYRPDTLNKNLMNSWCGKNIIKRMIMLPTINRWKKVFSEFYKEHVIFTEKIYTNEDDFLDFPLDADYYCTGSDQVWNSSWNKGIIKPLYLSFIPENKYKFSLSASFGRSELSVEEVNETKSFLEQYKMISVREVNGVKILQEQYNISNVVQLIDPTLSLNKEFWLKIANKNRIKKDYILIYNLNRSKEFDKYAKKLAKITGLKLVRFCTRYDQLLRCGKSMLIPQVEDFVTLIANAKYVLTDSFHATAFSINLNVEPICVYPENFGNRIESFLKLTNTTCRHIKNYDDFEVINRHIDFEKVNNILDEERKRVDEYLKIVFK